MYVVYMYTQRVSTTHTHTDNEDALNNFRVRVSPFASFIKQSFGLGVWPLTSGGSLGVGKL